MRYLRDIRRIITSGIRRLTSNIIRISEIRRLTWDIHIYDNRCLAYEIRCLTSHIRRRSSFHQTSDIWYQTSDAISQTSYFRRLMSEVRRLIIDISHQTSDMWHMWHVWHMCFGDIRSRTSDIHQTSDAWQRTSANKHQMSHLKSNIKQILCRDHRSNIYQTSDIRHHTHVTHQTSHPMCFGAIRCLTSDRHQMSAIRRLTTNIRHQTVWQQTSNDIFRNGRLMSDDKFLTTEVWWQRYDIRRLMSDVRWQMSEKRRLISEVWWQTSVVWCEMCDDRCLMSDVWCLMCHDRCLMSDVWWQMSDNRRLMSDVWWQISDVRRLMTDVW